ncbi:hypothetical protein BDY19DRAFT_967623 [Irpex rosettiformis]|uniref:Uncharacterized protein n=1 Tax=Irpex rosettiformis TaxID=378272 RepID=A0ACB8TSH8_9APHY|nr:hypothetical protein BDY19DRAFT_967623 [Irpex rosettiformis]
MGTRGLLGYIIHGKHRGTYVHFDSYPQGLGTDIASFLAMLTEADRVRFIERLNKIKWVAHDDPIPPETMEEYKAAGYHLSTPTYDEEREVLNWDMLLWGVQGTKMFQPILEGKLRHMLDSTEFATDALFCEWAYWVDFENERMEVDMLGGRRWGRWTFAGMKVPQSYWWTMVENAEVQRKREEEEREAARQGRERFVQDEYVYLDATECRDAPSGVDDDDDSLAAGTWDSWSDDEGVVING